MSDSIRSVGRLLSVIDAGGLHGELRFPHSNDWDAFRWLRNHAKAEGVQDIDRSVLEALIGKAIKFHRTSLAHVLSLNLFEFQKLLQEAGIGDADQEQQPEPEFLDLRPDYRTRSVTRTGHSGKAEFGRNDLPWRLFVELLEAKDGGRSRNDLMKQIYSDEPRTPNVLDKHKGTAKDHLENIRIEIESHPEKPGIWRLNEL